MDFMSLAIFPLLFSFIPQLIASIGGAVGGIGTGVGTAVGTGLTAAGMGTTGTAIGTGLGTALGAPGALVSGLGGAMGGGGGLTAAGGLLSGQTGGLGVASLPEVLGGASGEMMGLGHGVTLAEGAQIAGPSAVTGSGGAVPLSAETAATLGPGITGGAVPGEYGQLSDVLKQGSQLFNQQEQEPQDQQITQLPPPKPPSPPMSTQPGLMQQQIGIEQLLQRLMQQKMASGQGIAGAL